MACEFIFQRMQRIGAGPIQIFYSTHSPRCLRGIAELLSQLDSRMKTRVLLLLLALATSGWPAGERWLRLKSPNFDLYTDAGASRGKEVLSELEQLRNAFVTQAGGRNISPAPVRVFLFRSEASFRPFQVREASAGYFHHGAEGDYIAMRASQRTASHEYVHVVLQHSARDVPLWFGEGIAEFYSTVRFLGRKMSVGEPIAAHIRTLQNEKLISLKTLLAVDNDSTYYRQKGKLGLFYAQSWALVHMLHVSERYRAGVGYFVTRTLRGESDALRAAFGRTDDEIERDLAAYISRGVFAGVDVPFTGNGKPEKFEAESLSELDSALLLANLFTVTEKRADAERAYRSIIKAHPASGDAEAALGYLALAKAQDTEAVTHFRSALELGIRNARLCYDMAMLRREQGAPEVEVIGLLHKSVQFDPKIFESHYFLGSFSLEHGKPAEAVESFRRAADLQPNRPQVWEYLALAYHETNNRGYALEAANHAVAIATNQIELDRTQATLHLVESTGPSSPAKSAMAQPGKPPANRIEGSLTQVDCLGEMARLRIDQANGKTFLLVRDPHSVALKNTGTVSFEFACGAIDPRPVVVDFLPSRNTTYGTAGEIRSIELR